MRERTGPSEVQRSILSALQGRRRRIDLDRRTVVVQTHRPVKHVYAGTVDPVTIAERRRRNKAARQSRRINRRAR